MKQLIETFINEGNNKGMCCKCYNYFKKGDFIIVFDKVKVYKIARKKLCVMCYLQILADGIGWDKINKIILKNSEEKI